MTYFSKEDLDLLDQIKPLVAKGVGRPTIMARFKLKDHEAKKLIKQAKEELLQSLNTEEETSVEVSWDDYADEVAAHGFARSTYEEPAKPKKSTEVEKVRQWLDQDFDSYEIAKIKQTTPITTVRLIQKAENKYNPTKDWVQKAAYRGVKLSELVAVFGPLTLKRAKQIVAENFPNCFVIETPLSGGDTFITPLYASAKEVEELKLPGEDKRFHYSISFNKNYMFVKFDDDIEADSIEIYNLSDIHKGANGFREGLFETYIDHILAAPNRFAIIGGDLAEMLHKNSVGDPTDAYLSNTKQVMGVVRSLKRIAHRILDWVYSNHDDGRTEKAAQVRQGEVMANWLGVPFFRHEVIVQIEFRGVRKIFSHAHNYGKAFADSRILQEIRKRIGYRNFEINAWFSGHVHRGNSFYEPIDNLTLGRGLDTGGYWVLISGSTLSRTGTYAEREGYAPTSQALTYWVVSEDGTDTGLHIPVKVL